MARREATLLLALALRKARRPAWFSCIDVGTHVHVRVCVLARCGGGRRIGYKVAGQVLWTNSLAAVIAATLTTNKAPSMYAVCPSLLSDSNALTLNLALCVCLCGVEMIYHLWWTGWI